MTGKKPKEKEASGGPSSSKASSSSSKKKTSQNHSSNNSKTPQSPKVSSQSSSSSSAASPKTAVVYQAAGAELLTLEGSHAAAPATKPHRARHSDRAPYLQNKALRSSYAPAPHRVSPAVRKVQVNVEEKLKIAYTQRQDSIRGYRTTTPNNNNNCGDTTTTNNNKAASDGNAQHAESDGGASKKQSPPSSSSSKQQNKSNAVSAVGVKAKHKRPRQKLFVRSDSMPALGRDGGFASDSEEDEYDNALLFFGGSSMSSPTTTTTTTTVATVESIHHSDAGGEGGGSNLMKQEQQQQHNNKNNNTPSFGESSYRTPPRGGETQPTQQRTKRTVRRRRSGSFVDEQRTAQKREEAHRGIEAHFSGSSAGSSVIGLLLESTDNDYSEVQEDLRVLASPPRRRNHHRHRSPSHIFLDDDSSVSSMVLRRYDMNESPQKLSELSLQIPEDIMEEPTTVTKEMEEKEAIIAPHGKKEKKHKKNKHNGSDGEKEKSPSGNDEAAKATKIGTNKKEKTKHGHDGEAKSSNSSNESVSNAAKPRTKAEPKPSPKREKLTINHQHEAGTKPVKVPTTPVKQKKAVVTKSPTRKEGSGTEAKEKLVVSSGGSGVALVPKVPASPARQKKTETKVPASKKEKKGTKKSGSDDSFSSKEKEVALKSNNNNTPARGSASKEDRERPKAEKKKKTIMNELADILDEDKQHKTKEGERVKHKKKKRSDDSSGGSNTEKASRGDRSTAVASKPKKIHSSKHGAPPVGKRDKMEHELRTFMDSHSSGKHDARTVSSSRTAPGGLERDEEKDLMELFSMSVPEMRHTEEETDLLGVLSSSFGEGTSAARLKGSSPRRKKVHHAAGESSLEPNPWSDFRAQKSNPWKGEESVMKKASKTKKSNAPSHHAESQNPRKTKDHKHKPSPVVVVDTAARSKKGLTRSNSVPRWMSESGRMYPIANGEKMDSKPKRGTTRSVSTQSPRSQKSSMGAQSPNARNPAGMRPASPIRNGLGLSMQLAYHSDPAGNKRGKGKARAPKRAEVLVPPIYQPSEIKT